MPKRKPARRESDKWSMRPRKLVLANELDFIRKKAAARIGCVVGVGPLILFSTESGDAWMLDPADHLAARIARDGEHESVSIAETDKSFGVSWKGNYEIGGNSFTYFDHDSGRITAITGYPTAEILDLTPK